MDLHLCGSMISKHLPSFIGILTLALSGVVAQSGPPTDVPTPFIFYNASLEIGKSAYVSWDTNTISGPINLWVRENYPNASRPHIPLSSANTVGYMLWEASAQSDFDLGLYYYEIQSTSGEGVIYKSNPWSIICATCPYPSSTTAAASTTSSTISHSSYLTAYTSSTTSTIGSSTTTTPSSAGTSTSIATAPSEPSTLSPGAAAGIGVGAASTFGIVLLLIWLRFKKIRKRRRDRTTMSTNPQPWVTPPPHHIGDSPEMTTYSSSPAYKSPSHNHHWSQELHGSGQQSAPQSPNAAQGTPDFSQSQTFPGQSSTPAPQPPYHPHSPTHTAAPVAKPPPQPYHPPPQPNQPWMNAALAPEGNMFPSPSWEVSPRSEQEGFQGHNDQRSPENQQGLFPRRAVGS